MKNENAIREICLVAGFFSFVIGLWLVYPPATFILGGGLLMWLGIPPKKGDSS